MIDHRGSCFLGDTCYDATMSMHGQCIRYTDTGRRTLLLFIYPKLNKFCEKVDQVSGILNWVTGAFQSTLCIQLSSNLNHTQAIKTKNVSEFLPCI